MNFKGANVGYEVHQQLASKSQNIPKISHHRGTQAVGRVNTHTIKPSSHQVLTSGTPDARSSESSRSSSEYAASGWPHQKKQFINPLCVCTMLRSSAAAAAAAGGLFVDRNKPP